VWSRPRWHRDPRAPNPDPRRHVEEVAECHVIPSGVREAWRQIVDELLIEDCVAVLLREAQQGDRAGRRLRDRAHAVPHRRAGRYASLGTNREARDQPPLCLSEEAWRVRE